MIGLTIIAIASTVMLVVMMYFHHREHDRILTAWQNDVAGLQARNDHLVEQLARNEGKSFVPFSRPQVQPAQPGDGWFDGKPQVRKVSDGRISE